MITPRVAVALALLAFTTARPTPGVSGSRPTVDSASGPALAADHALCHVTQLQYDQLRLNMTIDDVRRILRCSGELKRSSDKLGSRFELYMFAGPREGSGVFAHFQNSRLQDKVSVDLD